MAYQLFTDVTADIDWKVWTDVHVMPMGVTVGGAEHLYGPGGDLTIEEFYKALRAGGQASTSQVTPATVLDSFTPVLERGEDILYLAFSSGLSGTYHAGCVAAEDLREKYPDRKIYCVDTLAASTMEGVIVARAARKKAAGMGIDELKSWALGQVDSTFCWFTVDDLDSLKRGGRVSPAVAFVGTALQIKPVLDVDEKGGLRMVGKTRGRQNALKAVFDHYAENYEQAPDNLIMIGHGDCAQDAKSLADAIRKKNPKAEIIVGPVGPVIAAHAGPGVVVIGF